MSKGNRFIWLMNNTHVNYAENYGRAAVGLSYDD